MKFLRYIGTIMFRIDRRMTSFELNYAHYRMARLDDELMNSPILNYPDIMTRKSDIQVEISRIRAELEDADKVIEVMA